MVQDPTPEDCVLLTSLADTSRLRDWARARVLVGLGSDDEVRAARRQFADLENVMFVVGDRGEIPWQDRFFSIIVDVGNAEPSPAMLRCLVHDGRIVTSE